MPWLPRSGRRGDAEWAGTSDKAGIAELVNGVAHTRGPVTKLAGVSENTGPQPGWYADPESNTTGRQRWWDGARWTAETRAGTGAPSGPTGPTGGSDSGANFWAGFRAAPWLWGTRRLAAASAAGWAVLILAFYAGAQSGAAAVVVFLGGLVGTAAGALAVFLECSRRLRARSMSSGGATAAAIAGGAVAVVVMWVVVAALPGIASSDQDAIDAYFGTHVSCTRIASGDEIDEAGEAAGVPSNGGSVYDCDNGRAVVVRNGKVTYSN